MTKFRLSSLLRVEERLLEAEYFARRLHRLHGERFSYDLNAFLSAARSVTFLLQKEMAHVPAFEVWWNDRREQLRGDSACQFFMKLRNFSQKEGCVLMVGTSSGARGGRWVYHFGGNISPVPAQLLCRDVAECCREHVAKLARIVLACTDEFPYFTCPRRALTPEGVEALELSLDDINEILGFPRGWSDTGDPATDDRRLLVLREHVDGLDFTAIKGLARWAVKPPRIAGTPSTISSEKLAVSLVRQLERSRG